MPWYKQKTTWTGITMCIGAVAGYLTGEAELATALTTFFTGLGFIFLRQGVAKVVPLFLICTVACSITYHDKRTVFQEGSITNNASGAEDLVPIKDADGKVIGFAAGTPSGDGTTATAGGTSSEPTPGGRGPGQGDTKTGAMNSSGFIIVSIGQNDGVEQKTDATVDATLDATMNKNKTPSVPVPTTGQ